MSRLYEWALEKSRPMRHAYRRRRLQSVVGQFVKRGVLAFDIGANHGDYSQLLLNLGARVVALEPQQSCVQILETRFGGNPSIRIVESAVARENGTATLSLNSTSDELATISSEWRECGLYSNTAWAEAVTVRTVSLDSLIAEFGYPQFCKIDVEGAEIEVLSGLSQALRAVSFEFTRPTADRTAECIELLMKLGSYSFHMTVGRRIRLPTTAWCSASTIVERVRALPGSSYGDIYARLS
jgi:FkbM family methyltransferase